MSVNWKEWVDNQPFAVMGILNVTPDSFSDGGNWNRIDAALERCAQMICEGAAIIDVGGESSRPGADAVPLDLELERTVPLICELRQTFPDIIISIDTYKHEVAAQAIEAGADIVNDISAMRMDPCMKDVVKDSQCGIVLMHMQGTPGTMQKNPDYSDPVKEIIDFLQSEIDSAVHYGIKTTQIMIDPGIGFGKTLTHNLQLLHALHQFTRFECPCLLGTSRKSFIHGIADVSEPSNRVAGTVATSVLGLQAGVKLFRVHDVDENVQALKVAHAIMHAEKI